MKHQLAALRTCANIDLPKYLGMYEFTVVLPALFAPDSTFYKTSDKSDLAAELRKLQNNDPLNEIVNTDSRKVIIIDGMQLTFRNFRLKIPKILQNVSSTS